VPLISTVCGAAKELVAGDPSQLATDVGPVIDAEAFDGISHHLDRLRLQAKPLLSGAASAPSTGPQGGKLDKFAKNQPVALMEIGH
jgi:delta 1-pyrroline-5-carboxylate dehydrogenase